MGLNLGLLQHLHWQSDAQINRPDLIHTRPDLIQKLGQISSTLGQISSKSSARSHPLSTRSRPKARPDLIRIRPDLIKKLGQISSKKSARSHPKKKVVWKRLAKSDLRNWTKFFQIFLYEERFPYIFNSAIAVLVESKILLTKILRLGICQSRGNGNLHLKLSCNG